MIAKFLADELDTILHAMVEDREQTLDAVLQTLSKLQREGIVNCAWCGASIGPGRNINSEPESCGEQECDREVRGMYRQMEEEARERAEEDGYLRYR